VHRGRGQNQNDRVLIQIGDIARGIVEEASAVGHNKEEVQRVAQLAQKVIYLLPLVQPALLTTRTAMENVVKLKDDLKGALETITQSIPVRCGTPVLTKMTSSVLKQQAKRIAELGNGVEQGYQTLTFAVVHHITNI
jgi:chorismate synthase